MMPTNSVYVTSAHTAPCYDMPFNGKFPRIESRQSLEVVPADSVTSR
jgi:hypothetical protein